MKKNYAILLKGHTTAAGKVVNNVAAGNYGNIALMTYTEARRLARQYNTASKRLKLKGRARPRKMTPGERYRITGPKDRIITKIYKP